MKKIFLTLLVLGFSNSVFALTTVQTKKLDMLSGGEKKFIEHHSLLHFPPQCNIQTYIVDDGGLNIKLLEDDLEFYLAFFENVYSRNEVVYEIIISKPSGFEISHFLEKVKIDGVNKTLPLDVSIIPSECLLRPTTLAKESK